MRKIFHTVNTSNASLLNELVRFFKSSDLFNRENFGFNNHLQFVSNSLDELIDVLAIWVCLINDNRELALIVIISLGVEVDRSFSIFKFIGLYQSELRAKLRGSIA